MMPWVIIKWLVQLCALVTFRNVLSDNDKVLKVHNKKNNTNEIIVNNSLLRVYAYKTKNICIWGKFILNKIKSHQ